MTLENFKKYWPQLFLLTVLLYFFRETLFFGKIFVPFGLGLGDHNLSTVPLLHYFSDSLKQGQFPLWDPYSLGGFSHASGIIGAYHPLNFLLFRFLPFPIALNFYIFSIFLILAFGTFYFVKSLNLSSEAALVAALSFTFASGIVARIIHIQILGTIAYLPLLLLLTQKFFEKRSPLIVVLTGVVLALQIFYGHQPAAFISSIGLVGFFLFKVLTGSKRKKIFVDFFVIGAIFFIGLSLTAVHWLPGLEVFLASDRSKGINEVQFKEYPFHPGELSYFLRPTPIGNPSLGNYDSPYLDPGIFWENTAYVGTLGLLLAILAFLFLFRSRKEILFFDLLFLLVVTLALGKFTPLDFIWRLPPFSFLRMPARFLLLAMFSLSVLAAFGFDGLTQKYAKKRGFLGFLAAMIILLDLLPFGLKYNATYDAKKWLSSPQMAQFLMEDPSFFRYYSLGGYEAYYNVYRQFRGWQKTVEPYFNLRDGLALNLNLLYDLNLAGTGGGSTETTLWQEILYQNLNVKPEDNLVQPNSQAIKMLRLLNVKYLVSYFKILGNDFTLRKEVTFNAGQSGFYLYELKNPFPHAFIIHRAKTIKDRETFLKEFADENFDPQKTVLLEESFENISFEEAPVFDKTEVTSYLPHRVVIRAQAKTPGFLLFTDVNFPGWEAKINGRPTRIYQADFLFRAVRLEPGDHRVEFEYKPKSFYYGALITLSTLVIITLVGFYWLIKKLRH